jgi:hypothetical protein
MMRFYGSSKLYYTTVIIASLMLLIPFLLSFVSILAGYDFIVNGVLIEDRIKAIKIISAFFGGLWVLVLIMIYVVFKIWE